MEAFGGEGLKAGSKTEMGHGAQTCQREFGRRLSDSLIEGFGSTTEPLGSGFFDRGAPASLGQSRYL